MKIKRTLLRSLQAGLCLFFILALPARTQSNFEAGIEYVIVQDDPSGCRGLVTLSYDPGANGSYVSIGAQNQVQYQFFDIIVSNRYLPPAELSPGRQSISTWFDLSALGVYGPTVPAMFVLYIHLLTEPGCYPFPPSTHVDTKTAAMEVLDYNARGGLVALPPTEDPGSVIQKSECIPYGPVNEIYYRGCDVPNLDLDNSRYADTDLYAGDRNACVPTATSNSLLWMDKKYNLFYGFPPEHRALLDSLSRYMKRARKDGTFTPEFIRGKLDFINRHHLPLQVRFQSKKEWLDENIVSTDGTTYARCDNTGNYPTWEFLKQAMKEGCDVEINYAAHSTSSDEWYYHSVVVTGVEEYARRGKKFLTFKHDMDQKKAGGTKQEADSIFVDEDGKLRYAGRNQAFIYDIVAECPADPLSTSVEKTLDPEDFETVTAYPNPFNSRSVIRYTLGAESEVSLIIYNTAGQEIVRFDQGRKQAGAHGILWDAEGVAGGVYPYVLEVNGVSANSGRLVFIK